MFKPLIGGRRSTIEILFEILSACRDQGINKTAIMYRCSLSYDQLVRYLSFMQTQGLLVRNDTGQFNLTPRGESAFDHVAGVLAILLDMEHDGSSVDSKAMATREAAYGD